MNKLYNNKQVVVKGLSDFFENISFKFIKTAKLRRLNPLTCIKEIYQGKALFA